jgi:hypothetical protein
VLVWSDVGRVVTDGKEETLAHVNVWLRKELTCGLGDPGDEFSVKALT